MTPSIFFKLTKANLLWKKHVRLLKIENLRINENKFIKKISGL